jgi:hemerythrin-like metal-binding protein
MEVRMTLFPPKNRASDIALQIMDDEYAAMTNTMNELLLMLLAGAEQVEEVAELNKLIRLMRVQFQTEEQVMNVRGFSGLVERRTEHRRLLAHLEDAVSRLQHDHAVNSDELRSYLYEWFTGRVEDLDKQYGLRSRRHGVC